MLCTVDPICLLRPSTVSRVRRCLAIAFVLAVAGACTGGSAGTSVPETFETPEVTTSTVPTTTTTAPEPSTTLQTTTTSGRLAAPGFTLELGEGGTYALGESDKPVYLVFWAEWCPTCKREMPVVDKLSAEFAGRVDFVAPAWKSNFELTAERAAEWFPSGEVLWGLDAGQEIFSLYGIPYQPVTVLIAADGTVVEEWAGIRDEAEIRTAIEGLIGLTG